MPIARRHRCLVLLAILLISHAGLSVHVSTHASADQPACEMCAGHANPAHAIPASSSVLQFPDADKLAFEPAIAAGSFAAAIACRQRGPPRIA